MKEIRLSRGKVALVDDEDFEWLNQWKWQFHPRGYASRTRWTRGRNITIYMHHLILPCGRLLIDHIDGDKLNNQRGNLRLATRSQNGANRRVKEGKLYKGIHPFGKRWIAAMTFKQRHYSIGAFDTPEQAALAYDMWALATFGDFARTNFPAVSFS